MGAIAGIIDLTASEDIIEQMFLTMKKRGPYNNSQYMACSAIFLHTDSIKSDIEQGIYVMDWAGERYVICFDGYLLNREKVRQMLLRENKNFDGETDAELILHSYIIWKEKVLQIINGAYSFVIHCEKENTTFLARDRMGIRPLFYGPCRDGLIFASEMKTILSYPGVEAKLDAEGAGELLLLGPGRTPGSGVFCDIFEVEPGCFAVFQNGNLQFRRYWWLRDRIHGDSFDETVEKVRFLVMDSIYRHIKNGYSMGTMLSGGLDSSIVSAVSAREYEQNGLRLNTFSLDYVDNDVNFIPGFFQPSSDTEFIRMMQDELDSQHHWTILKPEDLVEGICDATIARDLPGMADVDTSLLAFCYQIRNHTSTVLSGECADELFGGYPWYREPQMRDYRGFPWAKSTEERVNMLQGWIVREIDPQRFVIDRYNQTVAQSDILPDNTLQERRLKEIMNLNFRWFMQTLLERGDRIGSYCNVDIRMPFCDYQIAEYLYAIPWGMKDYRGYEKGLLRHAMSGLIPPTVLYRKKSPFPKTHDPNYLNLVSELLKQLLSESNPPILQLVRRESLEHLLVEDYTWPWYGQLMRRPQTIVYMLQLNYWLTHYSVRIV